MSFNKAVALQELERLSDLYFNGAGEIPDAEFDALIRRYEYLSGEKYTAVGAPVRAQKTNKTGELVTKGKVRLPYFMGSVKYKLKGDSVQKALDKYALKYPGPWVISLKLDGNAGQYIAKSDSHLLYSKGNGLEGEDMSDILPYLELPKMQKKAVVRGELLLTKEDFTTYATAHSDDGTGRQLTCARNAASGILKNSKPDPEILSKYHFVTFQVQSEVLSTLDHYKKLESLGFEIPEYIIAESLIAEELRQILEKASEGKFEIDGLVISPAYTAYEFPIDENPKHMLAFKVDTCEAVIVTKVIWNVSPKGRLKPIVYYKPVMLGGSKCVKATGFHAKFILSEGIGPGAEILVSKAGNITPQVVRCLTPCEEVSLPDSDYVWDETKTNIFVVDPENCEEYQIQQLVHFAKHMKIDGLQKTRITTIYKSGINTISRLLAVSVQKLVQCERIGPKLASTIRRNIDEKINNANLVHVMVASNVFGIGFGETKLGKIVSAYPDILTYIEEPEGVVTEMLLQLGGFDKMAVLFEERLPLFVDWLNEHPLIVLAELVEKEEACDTLKGEVVVFTGFTSKKLEEQILAFGGEYDKRLTKRTTILVAKDVNKVTNKVNKLGDKGRLISKEDFVVEYGFEL